MAVAPGLVDTDLHATTGDPDRPARMAARIPPVLPAAPEVIAEAIAWLVGPQASYVTATTPRVAGGR